MQKEENIMANMYFNSFLYALSIFNIDGQSIKKLIMLRVQPNIQKERAKAKYEVLTYIFPNTVSPLALDSEKRFLRPWVNPKSKKLNQPIIEAKVSHIPYCAEPTIFKVKGTSNKDINTLKTFAIIEPNIFFLILLLRSLFELNLL